MIPCVPFIMKVIEDDDKKKSLMKSEANVNNVDFKLISSFNRTWLHFVFEFTNVLCTVRLFEFDWRNSTKCKCNSQFMNSKFRFIQILVSRPRLNSTQSLPPVIPRLSSMNIHYITLYSLYITLLRYIHIPDSRFPISHHHPINQSSILNSQSQVNFNLHYLQGRLRL